MKKNLMLSGVCTIIHSLVIPIFILIFITFYQPRGIHELLDMEHADFAFNTTIIFCITLVSTSITRSILYLIGRFKKVSRSIYTIWCFAEMTVAALFSSLYVTLMLNVPTSFFDIAGTFILLLTTTAIIPYSIIWLAYELYAKQNEEATTTDDNSLIRFYDEYKKLRLVIAPEAVIFIKSEDNYVQIHYQDQNRTKKFILRSSMKALEETLSKRGLVRCHRSYFINPAYIKIVHRDNTGTIVAELKQESFESIPISRKYQDAITRLL
ncbi:MAG: LytTR family transcriptional regulator [Bacteroidaceae bacterium]|nr:LytTR family transcriptional regulator [Bacteroidaceae bacterium]MBR4968441.1 LytTR family transcriptional regulator [Bacteroidaceae bacterium]